MTDTTQTADAVDSIIAEVIPAAVTEQTDKPEAAETDKPEGEQVKKTYTEEDFTKAQRDLERERRRIGKITAQKYDFKAKYDNAMQQLAELQKKVPQTTAEPDIKNYTDYGQYQKDLINYQIKQNAPKEPTTQQPTQEDYQKALWRQTRTPVLQSQVQQASQTFPDITQKLQANTQLLDSLPQHVADAFLEADNGALAIYQLLEDGMIPHLAGMSPDTVTAMIERAEDKALSRQKQTTKAPTPMTAARGTAPGTPSPVNMSDAQLRKWMNE